MTDTMVTKKVPVEADVLSNAEPNQSNEASPLPTSVAQPLPHPSTLGAYNPLLSGAEGDAQLQHTLDNAVSDLVVNADVAGKTVDTAVETLSDVQPEPLPPTQQPAVSARPQPVLTHVEQLTADVDPSVKETIREVEESVDEKDEKQHTFSKLLTYILIGLGIFLLGMFASVAALTFL